MLLMVIVQIAVPLILFGVMAITRQPSRLRLHNYKRQSPGR